MTRHACEAKRQIDVAVDVLSGIDFQRTYEIIANMRVARDESDLVDRLIEANERFYAEQVAEPFEFDAQQPNAVVRGIRG